MVIRRYTGRDTMRFTCDRLALADGPAVPPPARRRVDLRGTVWEYDASALAWTTVGSIYAGMTPAERSRAEAVHLYNMGMAAADIADELGVDPSTVLYHLRRAGRAA